MRSHKIRSHQEGLTLLEILLVIALIGLLAGFLLTDWGNVADSFGRRGWKQSIEEAFRRGHFLAETNDQSIRLRFDSENRVLILEEGANGTELETVDLPSVETISIVSGGRPTNGFDRDFFSVRFGRDGSAQMITFEVERDSGSTLLHNHPFSGQLFEGERDDDGSL
ncbi:MAG: type II secretion system protein [Verrucomicrobiota bacterium]